MKKSKFLSYYIQISVGIFEIIGPNDVSRYDLNLSDPNVLKRDFGVTLKDVWYFAPKLIEKWPYDVTICLIWTSPFNAALSTDWSTDVSKSKFKISHTYLNFLNFQIFYLSHKNTAFL